MSNKSLLIVASLAYDGIETSEQKVDRTLGGAGSFICLSVKHFECNSSIVSVVGNDFHNEDLELLRSCCVDISGIEIIKDDKTFYWSCIYKNNFKDRITTKTELNVMASFNPVISESNSTPDILLLGNLHPEIQLNAIKQIKKKPELIILDTMNYWIENFWDTLKEVINNSDLISINDISIPQDLSNSRSSLWKSLPTTDTIEELHSKCFTDKHMNDPAPPSVRSTFCSLVSIPSYAKEATINNDLFDI